MADEKPHELMTAAEVAKALRIDARTIARWARSGQLRCVRLPSGHRRYRREDIEKLLEGR
jgi:excisionase family DNA binding protein